MKADEKYRIWQEIAQEKRAEQEEFDRKVRERVLVELEATVWDSDWFYELVEKKIREILEEKK